MTTRNTAKCFLNLILQSTNRCSNINRLIPTSTFYYCTSTNTNTNTTTVTSTTTANNSNNTVIKKQQPRQSLREKLHHQYEGIQKDSTTNTKPALQSETTPKSISNKQRFKLEVLNRAPEDRTLSQKQYFEKLAKLGDFERANQLVQLMPERKSIYAFELLLEASAISGNFKQSFKTYNQMKKMAIKPTVYTLAHLINTCTTTTSATPEQIEERINKVIADVEKYNVKVNVTFLNIMMKVLISLKKYDKAIEFIDKIKASGLKPDIHSYTTYVIALSGKAKDDTDFDRDRRTLFKTLAFTSNTQKMDRLRAQGRQEIEKYLQVIQELKSNNVNPDRYFINTILHACKQTHYPHGVFQVWNQFKEMKFTSHLNPDTRTYDILLSTANYTTDYQKGMELIEEIFNKSIRPDIHLINNMFRLALRYASEKSGDYGGTVKVLIDRIKDYMLYYQLVPNHDSFKVLFATYSKLNDKVKIYELILEAKELDLELNIFDYTGIISGMKSDIESVMNIFRVIVKNRTPLTHEFIDMMLKVVKKSRNADYLEEVVEGIRIIQEGSS
eukprot:gene1980-2437_t